jgi:hypothetical protein
MAAAGRVQPVAVNMNQYTWRSKPPPVTRRADALVQDARGKKRSENTQHVIKSLLVTSHQLREHATQVLEIFPIEGREVRWRVVKFLQESGPRLLTSGRQHHELHSAVLRHGPTLRKPQLFEPVDNPGRV